MRVLTVIANPNPQSFCHALLERFTAGLRAGGHESEVVDLYAIRFDPVFRVPLSPKIGFGMKVTVFPLSLAVFFRTYLKATAPTGLLLIGMLMWLAYRTTRDRVG